MTLEGWSNSIIPSSLVPGIREEDYAVDVIVRIADSYGDEAEIIIPAEVLKYPSWWFNIGISCNDC